jgi:hypothetical protein
LLASFAPANSMIKKVKQGRFAGAELGKSTRYQALR